MKSTSRKTILAALHARLSALPVTALRSEVMPGRISAEGLLIQRDGEPGEPEVTLSPLSYHYRHRAEIEAVAQGTNRDATFDTLCASIGAALATDRTLGRLCDWVEAEAPRPVDLLVEGAASLKAAVIPVVLHYTTADPLGCRRNHARGCLRRAVRRGLRQGAGAGGGTRPRHALDDRSGFLDLPGGMDVSDLQLHQVATAQLAVDCPVEERQVAVALCDFETYPNSPHVFWQEGTFLADNPAFVPGGAAGANGG